MQNENPITITAVDNREFSVLAHAETMAAILMDSPSLRNMEKHPRQLFLDSLQRIKGNNARQLALASLIVWARWTEMMDAAAHTAGVTGDVRKRMEHSKECAPAGVVMEGRRYRRCEAYLCPMCWYRHVRDRTASLGKVFEAQKVRKIVRLVGSPQEPLKRCSKAAVAEVYKVAVEARDRLGATGALTTVRLLGKAGGWRPTFNILMTGTDVKNPEDVGMTLEGMPFNWTVYHVDEANRGVKLTNSVAEVLRYSTGVFDEGMRMDDLQEMFTGDKLVRSSASGILQSHLRDGSGEEQD